MTSSDIFQVNTLTYRKSDLSTCNTVCWSYFPLGMRCTLLDRDYFSGEKEILEEKNSTACADSLHARWNAKNDSGIRSRVT